MNETKKGHMLFRKLTFEKRKGKQLNIQFSGYPEVVVLQYFPYLIICLLLTIFHFVDTFNFQVNQKQ
jgi:hypothetical protein